MVQAIRRRDGLRRGRPDQDFSASRPSAQGPAFVLIQRLERGKMMLSRFLNSISAFRSSAIIY